MRLNLSRIRQVAITDLLGRDPVDLDIDATSDNIRGRTVMVTGAGGSIGSELCRQICRFGPAALVLVEQAENALFSIHRELIGSYASAQLVPCIADVCDSERMEDLLEHHRPAVLFHAAAHKHVPMMEWNPGEAIKRTTSWARASSPTSPTATASPSSS